MCFHNWQNQGHSDGGPFVTFVENVFIRSPMYDGVSFCGVPSYRLIFAYIACDALNHGGSAAVLDPNSQSYVLCPVNEAINW
jgi:hypothetical protein